MPSHRTFLTCCTYWSRERVQWAKASAAMFRQWFRCAEMCRNYLRCRRSCNVRNFIPQIWFNLQQEHYKSGRTWRAVLPLSFTADGYRTKRWCGGTDSETRRQCTPEVLHNVSPMFPAGTCGMHHKSMQRTCNTPRGDSSQQGSYREWEGRALLCCRIHPTQSEYTKTWEYCFDTELCVQERGE